MLNGIESRWDKSTTCPLCGRELAWEDVGYCTSDGGTYCQECGDSLGVVLDWSDSAPARRVQQYQTPSVVATRTRMQYQTPSNEIIRGESWQQAIRDLRSRKGHEGPYWDCCYNWRLHEDGLHLIQIR